MKPRLHSALDWVLYLWLVLALSLCGCAGEDDVALATLRPNGLVDAAGWVGFGSGATLLARVSDGNDASYIRGEFLLGQELQAVGLYFTDMPAEAATVSRVDFKARMRRRASSFPATATLNVHDPVMETDPLFETVSLGTSFATLTRANLVHAAGWNPTNVNNLTAVVTAIGDEGEYVDVADVWLEVTYAVAVGGNRVLARRGPNTITTLARTGGR